MDVGLNVWMQARSSVVRTTIGSIYAEAVLESKPRVAVLNTGDRGIRQRPDCWEDERAYRSGRINFVGTSWFVHLTGQVADVIVYDGFVKAGAEEWPRALPHRSCWQCVLDAMNYENWRYAARARRQCARNHRPRHLVGPRDQSMILSTDLWCIDGPYRQTAACQN